MAFSPRISNYFTLKMHMYIEEQLITSNSKEMTIIKEYNVVYIYIYIKDKKKKKKVKRLLIRESKRK